jgi:hypothetical protein
MKELHEGPLRKHFATKIIHRKILDVECWWPIMYRNVHDYCRSCDACQRTRGLITQSLVKLVTSFREEPFMKWGFDFMGLIKPSGLYTRNKYIFVAIDYVTKCVETRALKINIAIVTTKFLYECILTKSGCPLTIVID